MSHRDPLPPIPPAVPPPTRFAERRTAIRRAADRAVHHERALLARSLDVLANAPTAEARLGGVLELLARTVGAERAALVSPLPERRVAVTIRSGEDPGDAEALATWLDAAAPRTRARRAAAGPAKVSYVTPADDGGADAGEATGRSGVRNAIDRTHSEAQSQTDDPSDGEAAYGWVALPGEELALGFTFRSPDAAARVGEALPPQLARHAAVVLALVTEQLGAERELVTLRASEAERATFVSTVAHELRTPLTGLSGYLDLLLGGRVDDPSVTREFLERSRSIVGSMSELVGDLLELSRLESGALQLQVDRFSVAESIAKVLDAVEPLAATSGATVRRELPSRMRTATGDKRRVEQILTNLVANAFKFGRGGAIDVGGSVDGSVAFIWVRDEGPGIEPTDRDRIFERFHRLAAHERINGTGLGLAIARDLARAMDGDLGLASVPGEGSTFVLALPGPVAVDPEVVREALRARVEREEATLESRAVVRRLQTAAAAAGRSRLAAAGGRALEGERPVLRLVPRPVRLPGGDA